VFTDWDGGQVVIGAPPAVQVNVTVTWELFHPAALGVGETTAMILGAVFDRLTVTVVVAVLPATSVAVPVKDWPAPSVETGTDGEQLATPEPESAQAKETVTLLVFHPLAFGAGEIVPTIVGGVVSIFTGIVIGVVFPALSVHTPVSGVVPSVATTMFGGFALIPESVSAHAKETVTGVLFHPAAFGAGMTVAVPVGGVLSRLTVTLAVAIKPARSVTVAEIIWPAPSVLTV
jgi:hypothetical protein